MGHPGSVDAVRVDLQAGLQISDDGAHKTDIIHVFSLCISATGAAVPSQQPVRAETTGPVRIDQKKSIPVGNRIEAAHFDGTFGIACAAVENKYQRNRLSPVYRGGDNYD